MRIRQSDLNSFARCAHQVRLNREADADGTRQQNLSATAFGTVVHHALQVLEERHWAGDDNALPVAVATFEYYWHPDNIGQLVPGGVDVWLPRQTFGGLMIRGRDNLRAYYDSLVHDAGHLLALEHTFEVPWPGAVDEWTEEPHTLTGTVDRLALRLDARRKPYLSVDDFKSGQKPTYLRHALQWTVYSWASLDPGFWQAWPQADLAALTEPLATRGFALFRDGSGLPIIPRRGRWIAVRDAFGIHDVGWRTQADFDRMAVAIDAYIAAVEAGIYPLSISGAVCTYCPHLYSGRCGGTPFSKDDEGKPYPGV